MLNYKLLTPGPLTTSNGVKQAMLVDHCTWDDDYKQITRQIRADLLALGQVSAPEYTTVLMQGSGSFGVEAVISSVFAPSDKVLVLTNGAYGERIVQMLNYAGVAYTEYAVDYADTFQAASIEHHLQQDPAITHIIMVHCETTTGMLNNIECVGKLAKQYHKIFIVDAMSSFGGMPIPLGDWQIDFLISSATKCIQGVPGFSFILAKTALLRQCQGRARTLSLDLYAQWQVMEQDGKWRFTSPTHTVLAFARALQELDDEGGIAARHARYADNNRQLRAGLSGLGIQAYISPELQSPFISTFLFPEHQTFDFNTLYAYVKARGYAIYPGKLTAVDTFRLGNIGEIDAADVQKIIHIIQNYLQEQTHESH